MKVAVLTFGLSSSARTRRDVWHLIFSAAATGASIKSPSSEEDVFHRRVICRYKRHARMSAGPRRQRPSTYCQHNIQPFIRLLSEPFYPGAHRLHHTGSSESTITFKHVLLARHNKYTHRGNMQTHKQINQCSV